MSVKIIKQNGGTVYSHEIELDGCGIFCVPIGSLPEDKVLCGEYKDTSRATEVFCEMGHIGWNFRDPVYTMPEN